MGWPLTSQEYGGSWIYGFKNNIVSLGFVTGLDYPDPRWIRRLCCKALSGIRLSRTCWKGAS